MPDDADPSPRRRRVLGTTAAAGLSSLAGCSWLSDQDDSPADDTSTRSLNTDSTAANPPPDTAGPLQDLHGYRVASSFADSGAGTPTDPWVLGSDVVADPGVVVMDAGSFTTTPDGLATPTDLDYERWSVWLRGAGVRTTALQERPRSDDHLFAFTSTTKGNFGGLTDMGLFGTRPNGTETAGHLVYSDGAIFDLLFSDLIVRWGWQDGIHVGTSSSGTRIRNCWIENNGGWAVNLGWGDRVKLSNLHILSSDAGGVNFRPYNSQLSNVSIMNCSPGIRVDSGDSAFTNCYFSLDDGGVAIDEKPSARSNSFSNVSVVETTVGVRAAAPESDYANLGIRWSTYEAMQIPGDDVTVTGVNLVNVGSADGHSALAVSGDNVRITGVSAVQKDDAFTDTHDFARITGDGVVVSDVNALGGPWGVVVDGATETVLDNVRGVARDSISDRGTRTLVNGTGTNEGDPRNRGEWNGHADYAHSMGATVWDTTTSPWTPYRADGVGNWLEA